MKSKNQSLRERAVKLRHQGKTFGEILAELKAPISKSTLSYWCKDIHLSQRHIDRITARMSSHLAKQRVVALRVNRLKRAAYLDQIYRRVSQLSKVFRDLDVCRVVLASLYWCEGSSTKRGALSFGNSSSDIISLFLYLLRRVYRIDERKFRCTVQCRADQPIEKLERYWSKITKIPRIQFYSARIDPRSLGKVSRKKDYKGVCRIDYFSADVYNELKIIQKVIST